MKNLVVLKIVGGIIFFFVALYFIIDIFTTEHIGISSGDSFTPLFITILLYWLFLQVCKRNENENENENEEI
ncbi:hypothetical protein D0T57_02195 [Dysgonomonas sp. 511]|nr:hypothetical protein [Dysgonomonas sp. 511]